MKKGQSLHELVQDIKRLVRLAYSNAQQDVRDSLAYRTLRDVLNDRDLAFAISQGNVDTIDGALNLALKYEAFSQSYRKPALRQVLSKDSSVPEQSTNDKTVILLLMIGNFNVITVPNLGIPQKYAGNVREITIVI
jgi:hypothetical protein